MFRGLCVLRVISLDLRRGVDSLRRGLLRGNLRATPDPGKEGRYRISQLIYNER